MASAFPSQWGEQVNATNTSSSSSSTSPVKQKTGKKKQREQVIPEKYVKGAYQNSSLKSKLKNFTKARKEAKLAKEMESKLNISNDSSNGPNASTEDDSEFDTESECDENEYSDSDSEDGETAETEQAITAETDDVKTWLKTQVEEEAARVSDIFKQVDPSVHCLPFTSMKNFTIISQKVDEKNVAQKNNDEKTVNPKKTKTILVNRIEFDTGFSFEKIGDIQVSEPRDISDIKPDHEFVTLMLTAGPKCYFCVGYFFPKNKKNKLTDWIFCNAKNEEVQLHTAFEG